MFRRRGEPFVPDGVRYRIREAEGVYAVEIEFSDEKSGETRSVLLSKEAFDAVMDKLREAGSMLDGFTGSNLARNPFPPWGLFISV